MGVLQGCRQLRSLAILGDVGDELVLTGLDSLTRLQHLSLAANVSPVNIYCKTIFCKQGSSPKASDLACGLFSNLQQARR